VSVCWFPGEIGYKICGVHIEGDTLVIATTSSTVANHSSAKMADEPRMKDLGFL